MLKNVCEQVVVAIPIAAVIGCICGTYVGWTIAGMVSQWRGRREAKGAKE